MVNSIKLLVAVTLLLLVIGIFMLSKRLRFFFSFKTVKIKKNESFWILLVAIILVLFTALSEYLRFESGSWWITVIGLLVYIFGIVLQFFVIKQRLDFKKGLPIKIEGIYARLRYPGYAALSLILFGLCLIFNSLWAVMIMIVLYIPALIYKMAQEDTVLADIDENRFELYSAETNRIIPKVF